jgi:glycosyltransferase involved in cell wall biosynthesis
MGVTQKVLMLHWGQDWLRGSERCILDLAGALPSYDFSPVVLANSPVLRAEARRLGVEALDLLPGFEFSHDAFLPSKSSVGALRSLVQRLHVALIHVNEDRLVKSALFAAAGKRIPVICQLHNIPSWTSRHWSLLHQASLAVGPTRAAVAGLLSDGMPAENVTVIYNGVSPGRVRSAAHRADSGGIRCLTVGSLIERKGVDTILRAIALNRRDGLKLALTIVGDGPERAALNQLAADLGIAECVHFVGECADVAKHYASAQIMVCASRFESFNLTIAEAAMAGIPAVASRIPPHEEVVVDQFTGRLFPVDDPVALSQAILSLATDPFLRNALGSNAMERAQSLFSLDRHVAQFADAYSAQISLARSRRRPSLPCFPASYRVWAASALSKRLRGYSTGAPQGPSRCE